MSGHVPVLMTEVVDALQPRDGGRYVDGTFGGGGYTSAILGRAACEVIGGWAAFFSCSGSGVACAGSSSATGPDGGGVRHESSTLKVIGSPAKPLMLLSDAKLAASFADA